MKKKGQLGNVNALATLAVVLVVVGLVSVIGLEIMDDTKADLTAGSAAANATDDAITGIAKIPTKLPLIVTAAVGAILIGIVVTFLLVRARG